MTVRPQSQSLVRVAGFVRARRESARPPMRTPRPSGGASGEVRQGQHGRQRSRARRLMAEVSAHCRYFGVRTDVFRSAKRSLRSGAVGKWPRSRSLQTATYCRCPGRAEPRGLWIPETSGRARPIPPVSAVCGRRNAVKRPRSLRSGSCSGVERAQSWRVWPCAGKPCRGLAVRAAPAK